jgi:integrase
LRDSGEIIALGGGVYRWADAPPADSDLIEIAERVPHAMLCLETALARHGLIDAIPAAIDIAIPRGSTRPALQAPSRIHQFDPRTFDLGREELNVGARRPIGSAAVSSLARAHLLKAGVDVPRPGSHTLRHSAVQRLVDADFDLKTIGDFIGHRSARSTEVYAKVAVEALREVALGDGEEVLG